MIDYMPKSASVDNCTVVSGEGRRMCF